MNFWKFYYLDAFSHIYFIKHLYDSLFRSYSSFFFFFFFFFKHLPFKENIPMKESDYEILVYFEAS